MCARKYLPKGGAPGLSVCPVTKLSSAHHSAHALGGAAELHAPSAGPRAGGRPAAPLAGSRLSQPAPARAAELRRAAALETSRGH